MPFIIFNMKVINLCVLCILVVLGGLSLFSCGTTEPETVQRTPESPPPEPPPAKAPVIIAEDETEISQEDYEKTFAEVEKAIEELNGIIRAGDYKKWEEHLTQDFVKEVLSPQNLEQLNDQPLLKRNNIKIKTLNDYFIYVVVPSRASVQLDDLVPSDANRVKAFMNIRDSRVLIYQLEKVADNWKISTW
jgi:hypothetical protein